MEHPTPTTDPPPPPQPAAATAPSSSSTNLPSTPISTTTATTPSQNPSLSISNPNKPPLTPPQPQSSYAPQHTQPQTPQSATDQSRLGRPQWPQHHQPSNFNPSSSSSSATPPVPALASPASNQSFGGSHRGGIAIGVPATSQSSPYSPSFGQHQFGGLGRGAVSAPESSSGPTASPQVRPPVGGYQTTVSSGLGSASQMRPGVISVHQQQRPAPIRSITNPNNHPTNLQNMPGHSLLRGSSVGSPGLTSPSVLQSPQQRGQPQPWLAPSQGRPPLPSHTYRGQMDQQSMQQRPHVPQQQMHSSPGPSQHMQASSSQHQQQSFAPHQHDQFRQAQSIRPGSSLSPQPQNVRGLGQPRPASFGAHAYQPAARSSSSLEDANESSSIVSKRSILELVNQVDPSEKLDPEVVDILVDIAEDFVDSITTSGCSLAKHRKSNTLESKDILLHLERNWNMTIPGFGGDEIKGFRKPVMNDIHRERLAAVKKSGGAEAGSARSLPGQQAAKGMGRAPASAMDTQP